jgi:hypothetical protein
MQTDVAELALSAKASVTAPRSKGWIREFRRTLDALRSLNMRTVARARIAGYGVFGAAWRGDFHGTLPHPAAAHVPATCADEQIAVPIEPIRLSWVHPQGAAGNLAECVSGRVLVPQGRLVLEQRVDQDVSDRSGAGTQDQPTEPIHVTEDWRP